jgi:hypothetical protein
MPKSKQIALAWPMWSDPFGSGGKRVCTLPPFLPLFTSASIMVRTKSRERPSWASDFPAETALVFLPADDIFFFLNSATVYSRKFEKTY